jgi:hypothetical protein
MKTSQQYILFSILALASLNTVASSDSLAEAVADADNERFGLRQHGEVGAEIVDREQKSHRTFGSRIRDANRDSSPFLDESEQAVHIEIANEPDVDRPRIPDGGFLVPHENSQIDESSNSGGNSLGGAHEQRLSIEYEDNQVKQSGDDSEEGNQPMNSIEDEFSRLDGNEYVQSITIESNEGSDIVDRGDIGNMYGESLSVPHENQQLMNGSGRSTSFALRGSNQNQLIESNEGDLIIPSTTATVETNEDGLTVLHKDLEPIKSDDSNDGGSIDDSPNKSSNENTNLIQRIEALTGLYEDLGLVPSSSSSTRGMMGGITSFAVAVATTGLLVGQLW